MNHLRLQNTATAVRANSARWIARMLSICVLFMVGMVVSACGGGGGGSAPTPTEITTQPVSVDVVPGTTPSFTVVARGDNLRYQWQSSADRGSTWSDVSGSTAAVLDLPAVSATMSGQQYRVSVTGEAGSVLSVAATLTVTSLAPPVITVQPANQTVVAGASTSFSLTVSGSSPSYRWQTSDDGSTWSDIPGNDNATLPVATTVAGGAQLRFFRAVVSNALGSVTSAAARLTVTAAQAAPVISQQPAAANVIAPTSVSFSVVASGTPVPQYQWQVSTNNGSSWSDITSATAATYTLATTSTGDSGKVFRARIYNDAGTVFSSPAVLSVSAAGITPSFAQQPLSQSVTAPATATFTVTVNGSPTPVLQWQLSTDGGTTFTNINGATAASYTTPATVAADSGKRFRVVASNTVGSANSFLAILTVSGGSLLGFPYGVSADAAGNLAVAVLPNVQTGSNTFAGLIQLVTSGGAVSTLAGSTTQGFLNGTGAQARFFGSVGVALDAGGNVFVPEVGNNAIRRVSSAGVVTTFAGTGVVGFADGPAASASFGGPSAVAVDAVGSVYVAEIGWNTIRKITGGTVSTLAGNPLSDAGFVDGTGSAARFGAPRGVAVDALGNVYVADTDNASIRKITPAGVVTTLAGNGVAGFQNGTGTGARFNSPYGVAVDGTGNVYVVDYGNHAVRKITPAGVVTTIAGDGTAGYVDATGGAARFQSPQGISIDGAGNLYVADTGNRVVRKITPAGVVSTWVP
jgi:sugar lactone lactonase YvrE